MPTVSIDARAAAKIARYVSEFRAAERAGDSLCWQHAYRLVWLVENVSNSEDWHKLEARRVNR